MLTPSRSSGTKSLPCVRLHRGSSNNGMLTPQTPRGSPRGGMPTPQLQGIVSALDACGQGADRSEYIRALDVIMDKNILLRSQLGDFAKPLISLGTVVGGSDVQPVRSAAANHSVWIQSINETLAAEFVYLKALHQTSSASSEPHYCQVDQITNTEATSATKSVENSPLIDELQSSIEETKKVCITTFDHFDEETKAMRKSVDSLTDLVWSRIDTSNAVEKPPNLEELRASMDETIKRESTATVDHFQRELEETRRSFDSFCEDIVGRIAQLDNREQARQDHSQTKLEDKFEDIVGRITELDNREQARQNDSPTKVEDKLIVEELFISIAATSKRECIEKMEQDLRAMRQEMSSRIDRLTEAEKNRPVSVWVKELRELRKETKKEYVATHDHFEYEMKILHEAFGILAEEMQGHIASIRKAEPLESLDSLPYWAGAELRSSMDDTKREIEMKAQEFNKELKALHLRFEGMQGSSDQLRPVKQAESAGGLHDVVYTMKKEVESLSGQMNKDVETLHQRFDSLLEWTASHTVLAQEIQQLKLSWTTSHVALTQDVCEVMSQLNGSGPSELMSQLKDLRQGLTEEVNSRIYAEKTVSRYIQELYGLLNIEQHLPKAAVFVQEVPPPWRSREPAEEEKGSKQSRLEDRMCSLHCPEDDCPNDDGCAEAIDECQETTSAQEYTEAAI